MSASSPERRKNLEIKRVIVSISVMILLLIIIEKAGSEWEQWYRCSSFRPAPRATNAIRILSEQSKISARALSGLASPRTAKGKRSDSRLFSMITSLRGQCVWQKGENKRSVRKNLSKKVE
jgi:hypothetical protein